MNNDLKRTVKEAVPASGTLLKEKYGYTYILLVEQQFQGQVCMMN
jgi:hypothetical protein